MRRSLAAAAAAAAALLVAGCSSGRAPATQAQSAEDEARAAARSFLDRYVDPDGRVVRRDQGDDTVGEAQSYGLLLAEVAGDEEAGDRIWAWTDANLRRPGDGLLAHRWARGSITDDDSATDADLVVAWALLRSDDPDERAAGEQLAANVLDVQVAATDEGPVLAAGGWATGEPATLNPSYWALSALEELGARTGDPRWGELSEAAIAVVHGITGAGTVLPPDWVRVDAGAPSAAPAPGGEVPEVRYSLDAQRTVVWFAADDDPGARRLAAGWYRLLDAPERATALALSPTGAVLQPDRHAVPLVAAAAAAAAAGETEERDRLLDEAAAVDAAFPGYYGAAWVALGRALLTTDLLDPKGSLR